MASVPQTIGPYRIEARLGAGGMGEVYRAWDERLQRPVAIKIVRRGAEGEENARQRFRREARAAARLSHPSIIQIYDILSWEDGEAIVMELVEGQPLSQRLARGPLPLGEAIRLGRDIARGLAAAHARGIIHRDLKAENVMITAGGGAKILDFGVAKRLDSEASLTADGRVVGTFRAMSPEQARSLPLDPRSDLFSFGTLLYEMLSGRSPFDGGSALETLTRICTHRQEPLRKADTLLPKEFSDLVDRLLEKDPDRRPRSAGEVVRALEALEPSGSSLERSGEGEATWAGSPTTMDHSGRPTAPEEPRGSTYRAFAWKRPWRLAILLLAVAAAGILAVLRTPAATLYVAVPASEVTRGAGDESVDLMTSGLRVALIRSLASLEGVSPLAPEQIDPVPGPPTALARAVAADDVVTSRLECGRELCHLMLARVLGRDGGVAWTESLQVPKDRPFLLAEIVESAVRRAYSERRLRRGAPRLEVRPEDYAEYLRLRRAYETGQQRDLPAEALARLAAIRRGSPRFVEALVFEAEVLNHRFRDSRDPADLERAEALLRQARDLAPLDSRPLSTLFGLELGLGRFGRAEEALRELERLRPGDSTVRMQRARLLDARGEPERALALMREVAAAHPSWRNLAWLAGLEFRLGRAADARRHLEMLLARFPGSYVGRSLLAQVELLNGSPRRAAELYSELVRREPRMGDLANLGTAFLLLGRYQEAEARFREALALEPSNPFVALNLADALLLEGRRGDALEGYRQVLELVARDPGAAQWQLWSVRAQALAHLGRSGEAIEAVQEVLRLAPDNPQALYEISLVYTLLGDRSAALYNAGKALDKGVEPRWFSFPWFTALRGAPELRDRLASDAASSQTGARSAPR
jgi:tetratricopeptide (TPR) repeat protein